MNTVNPPIENIYSAHFKRLIILALPVIAAQLLNIGLGVTDVAMVGRLGGTVLAQAGLGAQYIFFVEIAATGFFIALGPIVARAIGDGDERVVRRAVRMSLWQALGFAVLAIIACSFAGQVLTAFKQPPEVIGGAVRYINIAAWGFVPIFIATALRNYLIAIDRNNAYLAISVIGFIVNIIGNYIFIFGNFGAPALGLEGSAVATVITRTALMVGAIWIVLRVIPETHPDLFTNLFRFDRAVFVRLLLVGAPISAGIVSEVAMFQFATIMMGWIGVLDQAAHVVVLNVVSTAFMIPLAFAIVASVRAGNALGRGDYLAFVMGAKVAIILVLGIMVITSGLFWLIPEPFVNAFLDSERADSAQILVIAVPLLAVGAIFQLVDGVQVVVMGVLRGVQDTFVPAIIAFFCYWGIGVPAGYFLAFRAGWDGVGVWSGLALGLGAAALFLSIRLVRGATPAGFDRWMVNTADDE